MSRARRPNSGDPRNLRTVAGSPDFTVYGNGSEDAGEAIRHLVDLTYAAVRAVISALPVEGTTYGALVDTIVVVACGRVPPDSATRLDKSPEEFEALVRKIVESALTGQPIRITMEDL